LLVGIVFAVVFVNTIVGTSTATTNETKSLENVEIREYEGQDLSSINDFRENSIKGSQHIDVEDYMLSVAGLVNNEVEYAYDDVISNYQSFNKIVTLRCVEGWSVSILWEGFLVEDLLEEAEVDPKATVVIFYAYDGYSTSLPLDYIIENKIMIAYKMNNVTEDYRGYWESRGYPNDADLSDDGYIPEFPSWIILPLFLTAILGAIIYRKRFTRKARARRF